MVTASVSGLASGLDTAAIINQLMQLEASHQTSLKRRLTTEQRTTSVLQDLNSRFAALATRAAGLTTTGALAPLTATSSTEGVSALAGSTAAVGSLTFSVTQTAAAGRSSFTDPALDTDVVVPLDASGTRTVSLSIGGTTTTVDTGGGTLAELVDAVNSAGAGVTATTLRLDDGTRRLIVTSTTTGADTTPVLTAADGSALLGGATITAGRDAAVQVGTDTIHSSTNEFTDLLPGLTVTVSEVAVGETATVTVARDTAGLVANVKGLVDAVNDLLTEIDESSGYDAATGTASPLTGQATVRQLRTALLSTVLPSDGTTLADLGIQTDRSGKLVLDEAALTAAYAADPAAVDQRLGGPDGLAARVRTVAESASDRYTGALTSLINGRTATVDRIEDSIADWDVRLELRRSSLTRQFTALETALSRMNSQSNWLAGQLGSLAGLGS